MELIPAIDIKDGRCVRLYQGDFAQETVYDDDPVAVACRWVAQGAQRLHVVDLDGARQGHPVNIDIILGIVRKAGAPVQLGGGLRSEAAVAAALHLGVERVILGTAAATDVSMVERLVARFGDAIIVGVDARDGLVATVGWTTTTTMQAPELVARMAALGVQRVVYTDISRDGTLSAPNYEAYQQLVAMGAPAIIASGGVSSIDHLRQLAEIGVVGAIVGKALYSGAMRLDEALAALNANKHKAAKGDAL
jgi:phosphoribosylformimino-5-aminoimidazole carboxamide ribotide isomerase